MSDWDLGIFQGKMEGIQDWLRLHERKKSPREDGIEDELPSALKKMVKTTMTAPIPVALPSQRKGNFGDGDLMFITRRVRQNLAFLSFLS